MKKIFIQILLCLFFLYPITGQILSDECGSVIGGFGKPVPLKTGWLFRKGDNPDWKDPLYDDSGWMRKNLPDYGKDKEVKVTGFIWYRCRILIPENMKDWNEPLGIEIGELRDADEVYFNGVLIGQTGQLVPTFSPDMHKIRIYSIPKKLFINGSNLIAVRNYSSTSYAGFSEVPVIYNETDLIYGISRKNVFGIMAGYVFILMGVYFIIASVVKSTNRGNLFFSLFTIALGFYTLLRTQYRYRMFDDFSDSFKCELLVLELLPILFLSFIFYYLNYK
ncbi:MAG: histidine kinase, partial [Leptospira sp.]|nr:histidine kinase [Leptospira sp.]